MKWDRTTDPNVIACGPFYIRRCKGPNGVRYLLGQGRDCLGGWDSAEEAKREAEVRNETHREQ